MRIVSLFSGAGGLDLGFIKAGFNIVYANEYDKKIWSTYEYNHSQTYLEKQSLTKLSNECFPQNVEGLIGGPPCQSWSLAGKMRGASDARGRLFADYLRVLEYIQPKFFVVENVKGMISKRHIAQFIEYLDAFKRLGYRVNHELLDAHDFGVPQNRERVFIVGIRNNLNTQFVFPEQHETKFSLKDALEGLPEPRPFERDNKSPTNNEYATGGFSSMYLSRNRRREWEQPSFTIQASSRHAPLHPSSPVMKKVDGSFVFDGDASTVRRLSVRECARIQTFPDEFRFIYNDVNDAYKMIGNAVPVQLGYVIAQKLWQFLQ